MDNVICKECQKDCASELMLHRHLRAHKITLAAYYQKHFPRHDKYDHSTIRFKSKDHYFTADFNSRENMVAWFRQVAPNEAIAYVREALLARKQRKGLVYAPTQAELRTILLPGLVTIQKLTGDAYAFFEKLGLRNRFSQMEFKSKPLDISNQTIIIDTREQKPLSFPINTLDESLEYGDYALAEESDGFRCRVERKTVGDFYGTLTAGLERFKRELQRAKDDNGYVVILIEGSFEDVRRFPLQSQVHGKLRIAPEFVFHAMRDLMFEFDNIQFLFVDSREHASRAIMRIFASGNEYRQVDLQCAYDRRLL